MVEKHFTRQPHVHIIKGRGLDLLHVFYTVPRVCTSVLLKQEYKSFHKMKGDRMVNQQKQVQQDTAYSAVDSCSIPIPSFSDPLWV